MDCGCAEAAAEREEVHGLVATRLPGEVTRDDRRSSTQDGRTIDAALRPSGVERDKVGDEDRVPVGSLSREIAQGGVDVSLDGAVAPSQAAQRLTSSRLGQ